MKDEDIKSILRRASEAKPFKARDGAVVYELFRPGNSKIKNMGIAFGTLETRQKARPHFHKISEEIYYILSGRGKVRVGDSRLEIGQGDAIYIPIKKVHGLENTSSSRILKVLAISSPAYSEKDIFFVGRKRIIIETKYCSLTKKMSEKEKENGAGS